MVFAPRNGYTSKSEATNILRRRAQNLCSQSGLSDYIVVTKENEKSVGKITLSDAYTACDSTSDSGETHARCQFSDKNVLDIARHTSGLTIFCQGQHYDDWFAEDLKNIFTQCYDEKIKALPPKMLRSKTTLQGIYDECFCLTSYVPEFATPADYDKDSMNLLFHQQKIFDACKNAG